MPKTAPSLVEEIRLAREAIAKNRRASRDLRDTQRRFREELVKKRIAREAR